MSEISANLKNLLGSQKPPLLILEVGFFSDIIFFFADYRKYSKFFYLNFISIKKIIRETFLIGQLSLTLQESTLPNYDD